MHPDWARSLRDQCAAAGVPFLFKQWGEWLPMLGQAEGVPVTRKATTLDGWVMGWAGKKAAGRMLDGRTHDGFPEGAHG
jgi:protein gp37